MLVVKRLNESLDHAPFFFPRVTVDVPQAPPAAIGVAVAPALEAFGEFVKESCVAAAYNDVIGDEGFLQMRDDELYLAHPFFLAELFKPGLAHPLLDDVAVAVRQIAELEREECFL